MATITRVGFGQVEPNHLSAQRTAQIYAQLPAASDIKVLENGQFVKYDYANGECNFSGAGEWMMVFNEVKLYDDFWRESYKDFAMIEENYTEGGIVSHPGLGIGGPSFEGRMVPRVIKINVGDHWTTNCLGVPNTSGKAVVDSGIEEEALLGKNLKVSDNKEDGTAGYLVLGDDADFQLQVVKVYTMADGQKAVKVMRVK
jgi:hypothetical protein